MPSEGLELTGRYEASDLDMPVSQTLQDLFDEGEDLSQYLIAAVQFYQPHLRGSRSGLRLAKQSLAGQSRGFRFLGKWWA